MFDQKNKDYEKFDYTLKSVPGDEYAFDVTVKQPNGNDIEFRVLTFGEINAVENKQNILKR